MGGLALEVNVNLLPHRCRGRAHDDQGWSPPLMRPATEACFATRTSLTYSARSYSEPTRHGTVTTAST
jgi:hypothetical protein